MFDIAQTMLNIMLSEKGDHFSLVEDYFASFANSNVKTVKSTLKNNILWCNIGIIVAKCCTITGNFQYFNTKYINILNIIFYIM